MIPAPHHSPDHPDYGFACEEALEPRLLAMLDEMERTGMSRAGAARWLAKVIADPARDEVFAAELADARAQAAAAGWTPAAIEAALSSLSFNLPKAFETEA